MQELLKAYINTDFKVYDPCLIIKIGVSNHQLDDLLISFNATTWAYITAYNPYSKLLAEDENQKRHIKLKETLGDYIILEGEGIGEDETWQPEKSFLVIGIPLIKAIDVGKLFEQNAIVIGVINGVPELKILI